MAERRTRATTRTGALAVLLLVGVALVACERADEAGPDPPQGATLTATAPPRGAAEAAGGVPTEAEGPPGHDLYQAHCAVCHGARGGGGVGPRLAGNPNLQVTDYVVAQVLLGGGGMPPFAPRLSEPEIAAVTSFVRTSWGNHFGEVSPAEVEVQRSGLRPGMRLGGAAEAPPVDPDDADPSGTNESEEAQDAAASDARNEAEEVADDVEEAEAAASDVVEVTPADGSRGVKEARGLSLGERVYVQQGCSGCHGAHGGGGVGPALAGNPDMEDEDYVVRRILHGGGGMPPFADQLGDEEIAAVASHERTAWGNGFGPVDAERVAQQRSATEGQP